MPDRAAGTTLAMPDFRATHAWLRGYSDAVGGFDNESSESHDPAAYERGYASGTRQRKE